MLDWPPRGQLSSAKLFLSPKSVSVRLVVPVTVPLQLEVVAPGAPVDPETLVPLVPADDDVVATPPNRGHALSEL